MNLHQIIVEMERGITSISIGNSMTCSGIWQ